jgi:hypothetical protein
MALKKMNEKLPDLSKRLEIDENRILKELSENAIVGLWIREASKFLLQNDERIAFRGIS